MKRLFLLGLVVTALCGAACTLLLPTDELITPCVSNDDCADGFECQENACLPVDEGAEVGEGEGEGE